jgi:hypothetical protein
MQNLKKYPKSLKNLKKNIHAPDSPDSYRDRWSQVQVLVGPQHKTLTYLQSIG